MYETEFQGSLWHSTHFQVGGHDSKVERGGGILQNHYAKQSCILISL